MNTEAFLKSLNESRNGANFFVRHPLCRNVAYSDGVKEIAEAGCYWLLDILASELPAKFKENKDVSNFCVITVRAKGSKAVITGEWDDGVVGWKRAIDWTDLPDGNFNLYMADDQDGPTPYRIILPSEN